MIEVMQDIYGALSGDPELQNRLATDTETGAIAIYTETAQDKAGPYLLLTFGPSSEETDLQSVMMLQVDAIDRSSGTRDSIVPLLHVRDAVVRVLDRRRTLFGTRNVRVFYVGERPIASDSGRFRRYAIDFSVRYNRSIS